MSDKFPDEHGFCRGWRSWFAPSCFSLSFFFPSFFSPSFFFKSGGGRGVLLLLIFGVLSAFAAEVKAQGGLAEHRDMLIAKTEDQLAIGTFVWGSRHIEIPVSVHWGKFDQQGEGWAMSSKPGFNSLQELPAPYQALSSAQELRIAIQSVPQFGGNLGYWSGTGPIGFQAPIQGERLSIVHALTREEVQFGGEDASGLGFVVGSTGQGGVLHEHHEFVLKAGQGLMSPSSGLYAFAMQWEMDGPMSSDLVVIVLQMGELPPEVVSMAMEWLNQEFPVEGEDSSSSEGCRIGAGHSPLGLCLLLLLLLLFLAVFRAGCRRSKVN